VQRIAQILELEEQLPRRPRQLSGGQRQRVAMGRAMIREPQVYLMDEPLSNLDAKLRTQMRAEIGLLHKEIGVTTIYVTHDQVEAMTLADRIVVLQAGNLIQYDTPDGIYNRPAAKFVAGFTGSPPMNFLPCRIGEGGRTLHLVGGVDLPVPASRVAECARHVGRALSFGLRPEHINTGSQAEPGSFEVPGTVMLVEPLGSDTLGLIRIGAGADAGEMTGRFVPEAGLKVGQSIPLSLALNRFHLFDPDTGVAVRGADW
jgi:multiple sugar transport system ATP-binding protein